MKPRFVPTLDCSLLLYWFSQALSDCKAKRESALKLVERKSKNHSLGLAIVVPNCNHDGTYKTLQCHYNSNFCQCWDGSPSTQLEKNLNKCACLVDRAKALKTIFLPQTEIPEITSYENDGSYPAKQCNRQACWCVNPETGSKLTSEN